jgi:MFS transporter, SP family, sugar:H+ symporter
MIGFMQVFGYRSPESPVGWNISPERQKLISSLMTLGAAVASGFSGPMSYKLGRKSCIWIACALCAVSDVIMMATTSIGGLYAGRLLIGLANGMLMSFSQLYLQECTPAQFRGMALSAFQFWTSIGTLVSPTKAK